MQATQLQPARRWWRGPHSILLAAVANGGVYTLASALGLLPADVLIPPANRPITLAPVLLLTVFGTRGSWLVVLIVQRLVRRQPTRVFGAVVGTALLL